MRLCRALFGHEGAARCVVCTPEGFIISGGSDATARVWHDDVSIMCIAVGEPVVERRKNTVAALAVGLGAGKFATGSLDGKLRIFNLSGGMECVLEGHSNGITSLSMAGDAIVSGSFDGTARLWSDGSSTVLPHGENQTTGA